MFLCLPRNSGHGTLCGPIPCLPYFSELKYAGVGEALWDQHLAQWEQWNARRTAGQGFRRYVAYLDGKQEAWWTADFARSGKVARLGRVMPCLSRVLLCGGAGTPLLVQTCSGQASLRKELASVLARIDEIRGDGEFGRLLVVDAELASVELFEALSADKDEQGHPQRELITVLRGAVFKNLRFEPDGEPLEFREQLFRRGREGGGLQHTHGYGRRGREHVWRANEPRSRR